MKVLALLFVVLCLGCLLFEAVAEPLARWWVARRKAQRITNEALQIVDRRTLHAIAGRDQRSLPHVKPDAYLRFVQHGDIPKSGSRP